MLLVLPLVDGCGSGQGGSSTAATSVQIRAVKGRITLDTAGGRHLLETGQQAALHEGDTVEVGHHGEAIVFTASHLQFLRGEARLKLEQVDRSTGTPSRVRLWHGVVSFLFPETTSGAKRPFAAQTNTLIAAVEGTIFELSAGPDRTGVAVLRGRITVKPLTPAGEPTGEEFPVSAGEGGLHLADSYTPASLSENEVKAKTLELQLQRTELGVHSMEF